MEESTPSDPDDMLVDWEKKDNDNMVFLPAELLNNAEERGKSILL